MSPYDALLELRRLIRGSTTKSLKTDEIPVHVRQRANGVNDWTSQDTRVELRVKDASGNTFIISAWRA